MDLGWVIGLLLYRSVTASIIHCAGKKRAELLRQFPAIMRHLPSPKSSLAILAAWRAKKDLRPRRHPPEADAKNPRRAEILLQISDLAEGVIHALHVRWPQSAARTNPNLRRVEANAPYHAMHQPPQRGQLKTKN